MDREISAHQSKAEAQRVMRRFNDLLGWEYDPYGEQCMDTGSPTGRPRTLHVDKSGEHEGWWAVLVQEAAPLAIS